MGAELPPPGPTLVAVSGGPDSTALLCWLKGQEHQVTAAHYDHALRPDSEAEAVHVEDLCCRLGVELISERRSEPLPPGSLQAAARALRYRFLERARQRSGCRLVATAHTADDVVEGVLLHLLRGSGIAGLRGMPARRGTFVRPFINIWRRQIENYLSRLEEPPLRDPSNLLVDRFARARIRHLFLPELERMAPGITQRIYRVAVRARKWQVGLEAKAVKLGDDRLALAGAGELIRRQAYRQLYGVSPGLSRRHLEALDRLLLLGKTGDGLDLPGRRRARLLSDRLRIEPCDLPLPPPSELNIWLCSGCSAPRAIHLRPEVKAADLHLGQRIPGLRLFLGFGSRKLQDILVDAKVPRHLRDRLPLLFSGSRLIWVPGIAADRQWAVPLTEPGLHVSLKARLSESAGNIGLDNK
ncbi:MAG: tRNA lysidine(34) synthetase TilS [Candidatus Dormibacteraceae bacterium]